MLVWSEKHYPKKKFLEVQMAHKMYNERLKSINQDLHDAYINKEWRVMPHCHQQALSVLELIRTDDLWLEYLDNREDLEINKLIKERKFSNDLELDETLCHCDSAEELEKVMLEMYEMKQKMALLEEEKKKIQEELKPLDPKPKPQRARRMTLTPTINNEDNKLSSPLMNLAPPPKKEPEPDKKESMWAIMEDDEEMACCALTYCEVNKIWRKFFRNSSIKDNKYQLELKMDTNNARRFVNACCENPMPDGEKIALLNVPEESEAVQNFLEFAAPPCLQSFEFNASTQEVPKLMNIEYYSQPLEVALLNVTKSIKLFNFEISDKQITPLLAACKDTFFVEFCQCFLKMINEPNLKCIENPCIKELSFNGCGSERLGLWTINFKKFENIISGLSKITNMTRNLDSIYMKDCGLTQSRIRGALSAYGFENTKILEVEESPEN